ncbi:MAG: hypothetical protein HC862_30030 [Scytonema sp. RU_4_4]|nr:hypothetical protein [Scytonema sp. RU_4_4]
MADATAERRAHAKGERLSDTLRERPAWEIFASISVIFNLVPPRRATQTDPLWLCGVLSKEVPSILSKRINVLLYSKIFH